VLFFHFGVSYNSFFAEEYKLHEFEKKAIENRLKIQKYHITISGSPFFIEAHQMTQVPIEKTFYLDGDKSRWDITFEREYPSGEKIISTYIRVWADDNETKFDTGVDSHGSKSAVSIIPKSYLGPLQYGLLNHSNILRAGFNSCGLISNELTSKIIGVTDRLDSSVQDDTLNGIKCKKFSYVHPNYGIKCTYWIADSKGYSVLRMESKSYDGTFDESRINYAPNCEHEYVKSAYGYLHNITAVEVAEYKNSGLWFPVSMNFERRDAHGKLHCSEQYTITVHSLNESLDPKFFELAGMNIPAGTDIMKLPESSDDNFYWDGKKIVSEFGKTSFGSHATASPTKISPLRLLIIIIGLAMISMACFFKYLAYRKKNN
jgi:hypothetical protein